MLFFIPYFFLFKLQFEELLNRVSHNWLNENSGCFSGIRRWIIPTDKEWFIALFPLTGRIMCKLLQGRY